MSAVQPSPAKQFKQADPIIGRRRVPISPLRQRMLEDMSLRGSRPIRNETTSALSKIWRPF